MRAGRLLGIVLIATACAAPRATPSSSMRVVVVDARSDAALSPVAESIVNETNEERRRARLRPLAVQPRLVEAARLQAEQMARLGVLAHDLPSTAYPSLERRLEAVRYPWSDAAENIARYYSSGAAAVRGWMASSAHRVNILDHDFTEIGAADAVDARGRRYYVQVFGRPR